MAARKLPMVAADLLREHRQYDQYVDIVSAFEWLYTEQLELRPTVQHFERFPSVVHPDGRSSTPDFSVRFTDKTGLVGEIARIAVRDESVDKLCSQILRYDSLAALPSGANSVATVDHVDVLLLVPYEVGKAVAQRVLTERFTNPEHSYKPGVAPCIVQFVPQSESYSFQRLGDPGNGSLREGDRGVVGAAIGAWLERENLNTKASMFSHVKSERPFMNDPIPPLYLASYLWTRTFALRATSLPKVDGLSLITISTADIVSDLRSQTGVGRAKDVRRAMQILVAARAAVDMGDNRWGIAWGPIRARANESDLSEKLANRAENPSSSGNIQKVRQALRPSDPFAAAVPETGQLFNPDALRGSSSSGL